jgi:hypothetical protein
VKSICVGGIGVKRHNFVVAGVKDEAIACATLRGLDDLKDKTDEELKSLTKVSTSIGDPSMLQALAYLPNLMELYTSGINWTPKTLQLLGKLTTVKKLRVGGRYWAETNNFKFQDLEYLTGLIELRSLDLSYACLDGVKRGEHFFGDGEDRPSEGELARRFARGMKKILLFPNLKELILETEIYPKGAKVLTTHPNLQAILGAKHLSYEVVQILANSRLATQLTSLDFEYTRSNQLQTPVMAEVAKFVNITRLSMRHVERFDDTAMAKLAPLVNLKELYVNSSRITSEGLRVLRHMPDLKVLSLGYCRGISDGLDHINHLSLTHLDVRSIENLRAEHLLPVLRASPNLVDLNLRYAEGVDPKLIANETENLKALKFINPLSLGGHSAKPNRVLKKVAAEFYYEDTSFHCLKNYFVGRE